MKIFTTILTFMKRIEKVFHLFEEMYLLRLYEMKEESCNRRKKERKKDFTHGIH